MAACGSYFDRSIIPQFLTSTGNDPDVISSPCSAIFCFFHFGTHFSLIRITYRHTRKFYYKISTIDKYLPISYSCVLPPFHGPHHTLLKREHIIFCISIFVTHVWKKEKNWMSILLLIDCVKFICAPSMQLFEEMEVKKISNLVKILHTPMLSINRLNTSIKANRMKWSRKIKGRALLIEFILKVNILNEILFTYPFSRLQPPLIDLMKPSQEAFCTYYLIFQRKMEIKWKTCEWQPPSPPPPTISAEISCLHKVR